MPKRGKSNLLGKNKAKASKHARANESEEKRSRRLSLASAANRKRRENETEEQRSQRLSQDLAAHRSALKNETKAQRSWRLSQVSAAARERRENETEEQRFQRLSQVSAAARERREILRLSQICSQVYHENDISLDGAKGSEVDLNQSVDFDEDLHDAGIIHHCKMEFEGIVPAPSEDEAQSIPWGPASANPYHDDPPPMIPLSQKSTQMVQKCAIKNCRSTSRPFHEIPSNAELRQLWLEKIQEYVDITKIRDKTVLCGAHFTEDDYRPCNKQKRLNIKAIPSIFKEHKQPDEKRFAVCRSSLNSNQRSQSNPWGLLGDTAEFKEAIPKIEADVDPLENETAVCLDQEDRLIEFVDVQRHSETCNQENNQQHEKLRSAQSLKRYITALERENCKLRAQLTRANRLRHFAKSLCLENKKLKQKLMQTRQRFKARRLLRNSVAKIKRDTL